MQQKGLRKKKIQKMIFLINLKNKYKLIIVNHYLKNRKNILLI